MKRLLFLLAWAFVPILAANAPAQTNDGYVGIYGDSLGTQACASVPPYTSVTLYVIAKTSGGSATGITGAEFRIEVTSPSGWYLSYTPPGSASIVMGNPIDVDPDPNAGGGLNLGFPSCQVPDGNGRVKLGSLSVFNASGSPTNLFVKRHSNPSNASFACPLFVECDDPYYTKVCMTASPPDSCTLNTQKASVAIADDPTVFTASLNEGGNDPGQEPGLGGGEVLTEFVPGTISLPTWQTQVSLASVTINSDAVRTVLEAHDVAMVGKTFPEFTLADTLGYDRFGEPVRHANLSEHYVLTVPPGGSATALAADLIAASREVVFAEPNGGNALDTACQYGPPCNVLAQSCPNDPSFMQYQWQLVNNGQRLVPWEPEGTCREDIHADEAWEITTGDASTTIGVLDTGVNRMHEDLLGKVSGDEGYVCRYAPWHGTAVAGIAAAWGNNSKGVAGVDWNARILAKLLPMNTDSCTGGAEYDPATASAIRDAGARGADVLNNSWALVPLGRSSTEVRLAFSEFYMDKRIAVASMGNQGEASIQYPAAWRGIIAVGSTDNRGNVSLISSTGPHIDVVAPGENFKLCWDDGSYRDFVGGGTSFAAPHVSGLAGLLLSVNNNLEPDDVEHIISISADKSPKVFDTETGWGRINAGRALNLLRAPNLFVQDSEVGGERLPSDWSGYVHFEYLQPGVQTAPASAVRYPVERTVTFPVTFQSKPEVWGRGSSTLGYSTEGSTEGINHINFGMGWCAPVGPISRASCRLRTYVYELLDQYGNHLGWAPTDAAHVVFAYSALWEYRSPTDAGDVATTAAPARLALQCKNPLQAGGTLQVSLPKRAYARLEVFSVTGRRVAVLQDGILEAGRHAFAWQAHGPDRMPLGSGLYLARVEADGQRVTQKLILIR